MKGLRIKESRTQEGLAQIQVPGQKPITVQNTRIFDDYLYDTVEVQNGTMTPGFSIPFFKEDISSKNPIDTNMEQMNGLEKGEIFIAYSLGVLVHNVIGEIGTGYDANYWSDVHKVINCGALEVKRADKKIAGGPVKLFPAGFGVDGMMMTTAADATNVVVNNGLPASKLQRRFMRPQVFSENISIKANITFHNRTWMSSATWDIGDTNKQMPTFNNPLLVTLLIGGIRSKRG